MKRFEVEFNFVDSKRGQIPMEIKGFDTKEEAEVFAADHPDANIIEVIAAWMLTATGKKVVIW